MGGWWLGLAPERVTRLKSHGDEVKRGVCMSPALESHSDALPADSDQLLNPQVVTNYWALASSDGRPNLHVRSTFNIQPKCDSSGRAAET